MTADEQTQVESCLRDTLTRTSDWVKFGEAKNAALLTFASAWLLALGNLALGANPVSDASRVAINWAAPFVFIGAVIAIIAILPQIKLRKSEKNGKNPLFYDQVHAKTGATLLAEIQIRYAINGDEKFASAYLEDLAEQLAANSRIASRKFRLFAWGATSVLVSVLIYFIIAFGPGLVATVCTLFRR